MRSRAFLLKASEGRTAPDFSLKSLAGSPGRMDLVARCLISSLHTQGGTRKDVRFTVVLEGAPNPPVSLTFDGCAVAAIPAGEVAAAQLIFDALSQRSAAGVGMDRKDFERSIAEYNDGGFSLFYLHEQGEDSRRLKFGERPLFILGDQKGLDPRSEKLLDEFGAKRVSLGPFSYLASHCITVVNNELDNAGVC